MAVLYATELFDGRDGAVDQDGRRTYTRKWEVRTTSPYDGPLVATSAAVVPARGQHYRNATGTEVDLLARALDAQAEQNADDPTLWVVTVKYDSKWNWPTGTQPEKSGQSPPPPGQQSDNPLARPPVWRCTFQTTQKPATRDKDGNPILNTAGLPFDPPVMADVSYPVVTLTKNVPKVDFSQLAQLQDAVNSSAWKGFPARQVRVTGIEFESQFENDLAFWKITYQLSVRYPDWDFRPLNLGFVEKISDGAGGFRWRKIVDKEGREPGEPQPLKNDGTKAGPSDSIITLGPFQYYQGLDFSQYLLK